MVDRHSLPGGLRLSSLNFQLRISDKVEASSTLLLFQAAAASGSSNGDRVPPRKFADPRFMHCFPLHCCGSGRWP